MSIIGSLQAIMEKRTREKAGCGRIGPTGWVLWVSAEILYCLHYKAMYRQPDLNWRKEKFLSRPLKMASLPPLLLRARPSLLPSVPSSYFFVEYKLPANQRRPSLSRIKVQTGHILAASASLVSTNYDDSGEYQDFQMDRRKLLIYAPILPLILHESGQSYGAKASELNASMYALIKGEVRKVISKGKAASVLRLVFHDAGTFEKDENSGGMNGSIIYELDRPENAGLKKSLKILEKAKLEVESIEPDMIAVAGAEAVSVCGGPSIPVQMGRMDSGVPDAEGKLPEETLNASALKECFQRKGLSTQELVALSGAHTLGSKGFGDPTVFDNSYYKILLEKPWMYSGSMSSMIGLPSDRALVEDDECLRWIRQYAGDETTFFEDFTSAYVKLVNSGAKWRSL